MPTSNPPSASKPPFFATALIVSGAFFMEQMDSTIIATCLPVMAASLGSNPLQMSLAMTIYLLALVVFIPASGWLSDRYGSRTIFRAAIALFTVSSVLCAVAGNLPVLLIARALQGLSGAMMVPVGRLVLLRTVEKSDFVRAMAWVMVPAMIGPLVGPPLGGLITTYVSWRWVFLINVPIGLIGWWLAVKHIPQIREDAPPPFDLKGLLYSGTSLCALIGAVETGVHGTASGTVVSTLALVAVVAGAGYWRHARAVPAPVLDFALMRVPTFGISMIAGTFMRMAFGAMPFLLPMSLQLGLGFTPLQSGLAVIASGAAALAMKASTVMVFRRFGFRNVLIWNGVLCSVSLMLCAGFSQHWSFGLIAAVLLLGGLARSIQYNAFGTIAYAEIPPSQMSSATSFYSTFQHLASALGIALAVSSLAITMRLGDRVELAIPDFSIAFIVIALTSFVAVVLCLSLDRQAGAEVSGHRAT